MKTTTYCLPNLVMEDYAINTIHIRYRNTNVQTGHLRRLGWLRAADMVQSMARLR